MEISGLFAIVGRWWWTLLIATVVGGFTGFLVGSNVPPTYESESRLLVGPLSAGDDVIEATGQLTQTYAELVTSQLVLSSASDRLGHEVDAGAVTAQGDTTTRALEITVRSQDPRLAAATANTLAARLGALVRVQPVGPESEIRVVSRASSEGEPAAPDVLLISVLAAAAALLTASALVLLFEYFDDTVKSEEDLAGYVEPGFVGSVASTWGKRIPEAPIRSLVVESNPSSHMASAYRLLATQVEYSNGNESHRPRSLLVVTADGDEGGAELAANLALALVGTGRRVTLVDADEVGRQITRCFGLQGEQGFTELPGGGDQWWSEELNRAVMSRDGLVVVPRGETEDAPQSRPEETKRLLERLSNSYDFVVVHGGPALSPTSLSWARAVEGTVLVAQRNATRRRDLGETLKGLGLVGAMLLGGVLVGTARPPNRTIRFRRRAQPEPSEVVGSPQGDE